MIMADLNRFQVVIYGGINSRLAARVSNPPSLTRRRCSLLLLLSPVPPRYHPFPKRLVTHYCFPLAWLSNRWGTFCRHQFDNQLAAIHLVAKVSTVEENLIQTLVLHSISMTVEGELSNQSFPQVHFHTVQIDLLQSLQMTGYPPWPFSVWIHQSSPFSQLISQSSIRSSCHSIQWGNLGCAPKPPPSLAHLQQVWILVSIAGWQDNALG